MSNIDIDKDQGIVELIWTEHWIENMERTWIEIGYMERNLYG